MTTSPQKLTIPRPPDADASAGQGLNSIEGLAATLFTDPAFKTFKVEAPEDGVVSLGRDGMTQILLGPVVWKSMERRAPYLKAATMASGISVVLVGGEADFSDFPAEFRRPDVQLLGLPLSRAALSARTACGRIGSSLAELISARCLRASIARRSISS